MSAFASSADRVHSRRAETSIVSASDDSRFVYTNWPFKIAMIRGKGFALKRRRGKAEEPRTGEGCWENVSAGVLRGAEEGKQRGTQKVKGATQGSKKVKKDNNGGKGTKEKRASY